MAVELTRAERARLAQWLADQDDDGAEEEDEGTDEEEAEDDAEGTDEETEDTDDDDPDDVITYRGQEYRRVTSTTAAPKRRQAPTKGATRPTRAPTKKNSRVPVPARKAGTSVKKTADPAPAPTRRQLFT